MSVDINYWGVLVAGVSSMVIGAIYYSPALFGKQWRTLGKIDEKLYKKETPRLIPLMFLAALLTAYIMAHFMVMAHSYYGDSWLAAGFTTGLWLWTGVALTTLLVHNALDQRPFRLTAIALGNRLLSLLAMGLILGWLHP